MEDILKAALIEERQLISRLEAVRSLIRAYGGDMGYEQGQVAPAAAKPTRRIDANPRIQEIKDLVADLLRGQKDPVKTRDILEFVESAGIEINATQPVSYLSAMLARADDLFISHGRQGWTVRNGATNTEGSDAPTSEPSTDDPGPNTTTLGPTSDSSPAHREE